MNTHFTGELAINGTVNDLAMIETVPQLSANQHPMDGRPIGKTMHSSRAL